MRILDVHTHVLPQHAAIAVAVMDRCGIACSVTLEWHDGFGETLQRHLETFAQYPGRFIVFGNVDWRRANEPGFGEAAARQMQADAAAGMRGLKVYKALGLTYRRADGTLWPVNAPEFDPIWAMAGQLGLPVLLHIADPDGFWEPVDALNFWDAVLTGEYTHWSYYRTGLPSRDELLGERNRVIARHPQTTFICPHMGSKTSALDNAADDLDAFPNLYYDLSARVPTLGRSTRRAAHCREFMLAYQDRVLFGTDMIYDDKNVPTGTQAQELEQPGAIPLDGSDPVARYIETSARFVAAHLTFLATDQVQARPPFKRNSAGYLLYGLGLPEDVVDKILWRNAARLLGLG